MKAACLPQGINVFGFAAATSRNRSHPYGAQQSGLARQTFQRSGSKECEMTWRVERVPIAAKNTPGQAVVIRRLNIQKTARAETLRRACQKSYRIGVMLDGMHGHDRVEGPLR